MSGSAEFMARHLVFAFPIKLHAGFDDITRHHLDLVIGSADGKHVNHVGAGHSNTDGNTSWNHYAVRHEKILLCDHPYDYTAYFLSGPEITFHEFAAQMQSLRVDLVGAIQEMLEARLSFIWESNREPHADQRNADQ
jgi:hypothetical protein